MMINRFQEMHKDSKGIDGILANMSNVTFYNNGVTFNLNFVNRTGMTDQSFFFISYYDEDGSFRIDGKNKKHPFHVDANTTYIFYNRRFSAETLVCLSRIYHRGYVTRTSLQGYCADVLDGSGTKKAREQYGLKYNIHPSNLQFIDRIQNLKNGQHQNIA